MTEELLPCPFCGGFAGFDLDDGLIFVRCLDCGIQGKSFAYDWERDDVMRARKEVREVAGKYWNTRAQPKIMTEIKTWSQRCEEHPDHQSGMVTHQMIQARMQEEIDELRALPKYKRAYIDTGSDDETVICIREGNEIKVLSTGLKMKRVDLDEMKQDDLPPFTPIEYMLKAEGWDDAIDDIKSEYGDLYVEVKNGN